MSKTFVIAEAASCHDGSLQKALDMIQIAKAAGADAVKFQYWSDADRLADRRRVDQYYRDIYHRYQVPRTWLEQLYLACQAQGIEFMCTCYLREDIARVALYVKRHKISSFEAGDHGFLEAHRCAPVIFSTGMMNLSEVRESLSHLGNCQGILHCVSAYPCVQIDLSVIDTLRRTVGPWCSQTVGLSDHTANNLTGALAVAAGASILEVHFRHPATEHSNPDYAVAVPDLAEYVRLVRFAEKHRGDGVKRMQPEEQEMAKYKKAVDTIYAS